MMNYFIFVLGLMITGAGCELVDNPNNSLFVSTVVMYLGVFILMYATVQLAKSDNSQGVSVDSHCSRLGKFLMFSRLVVLRHQESYKQDGGLTVTPSKQKGGGFGRSSPPFIFIKQFIPQYKIPADCPPLGDIAPLGKANLSATTNGQWQKGNDTHA